MRRFGLGMLCIPGLLVPAGCVRRTISIRSEPPGALVWLNDREVGRTPVEVDFLYYGEYDVRIERNGYEPLMTSGKAEAPFWDWAGIDLFSELMPLDLHSRVVWNYALQPTIADEAALIDRARQLRESLPRAADSPETGATPEAAPEPVPIPGAVQVPGAGAGVAGDGDRP